MQTVVPYYVYNIIINMSVASYCYSSFDWPVGSLMLSVSIHSVCVGGEREGGREGGRGVERETITCYFFVFFFCFCYR